MKRIAVAVIAALAAGAIVTAVAYTPPDRSGCPALLRQAEHTSDAGTILEEGGCLSTPAADIPRP